MITPYFTNLLTMFCH